MDEHERARRVVDPVFGEMWTLPCAAGCGLHVLVTPDAVGPVVCLSCEEKAGKAIVKVGNVIRVLAH